MKNLCTKEVEQIYNLIMNLYPHEQQQLMMIFIVFMLQHKTDKEAEKTYIKIINHLKQ
tara:strand:- start:367 stop:540 length:174 start_codon:yes stop_codon:yes gene_type:complete